MTDRTKFWKFKAHIGSITFSFLADVLSAIQIQKFFFYT